MPQERLPKKPLVRRGLRAFVAAYYYWGTGRGRRGGRPILAGGSLAVGDAEIYDGQWIAELGRWDK